MSKTNLLLEEHLAWIGHEDKPLTVEISQRDIIKYSVATEQQQEKYLTGREAPPMFIFNIFAQPRPLDQLRVDGLARGTSEGPSLPLKRVMAGGKNVQFFRAIRPGETLTGINRIKNIYEKRGKLRCICQCMLRNICKLLCIVRGSWEYLGVLKNIRKQLRICRDAWQ